MGVSKKPRKPYKRIVIRTAEISMPVVFGLRDEAKTDLQLLPLMVLDAFRCGCGSEEGAHTLAAAVNLGAVLARKESAEVQAEFDLALDAMHNVMERGKGGKWGLSGDELRLIGQALTLSGDMQGQRTKREVRDAICATYKEAALPA